MRSGLTRHALRRHRWTLLGPACTQAIGAGVISMMVMTAMAIASLPPAERRTTRVVELADTAAVFIGVSVYLSILIVGVTMNLAIGGQLRDIALQRVIGASPGQVRRSLVKQAISIALPASGLGFLAAVPVGAVWVAALKAHGVAPTSLQLTPQWQAFPIALGVTVATSLVGTWIAARRVARIAPAAALTETRTGRRGVRPVRSVLGLALVGSGILLSATLSKVAADQAGDAAFFVMLAECVGVGMLGPWLLRTVAGVLRPLVASGVGQLALDDLVVTSRALSGALVPLVLAAAFAVVKIAAHTTVAHVTGLEDPAADRWADYSGTAIYCIFAGVASLNCFVTVAVGRRADLAALQLAGGSRRAVVRMVAIESVIVTATAVVLAAGVAGATLLPVLHSSLGAWLPHVPVGVLVMGVLLSATVVVAGMVAPAAALTRTPPIEIVRMSG